MSRVTDKDISNSTFFSENESGQILFYPWGKPGLGYYVGNQKKKSIRTFLCIIAFSLVIYLLIMHTTVKLNVINIETRGILNILAWAVFPSCYWWYVSKAIKPLKVQGFSSDKKPKIFYVLGFIMLVQMLTVAAGVCAYAHIPTIATIVMISHSLYFGVAVYLMQCAIRTPRMRGSI